MAEGRRSGGARPAVRAVSRGTRRHQVAARGSRPVPAALCRRHRTLAGAAPAGRRTARASRTAEAEARPDARRRHRQTRRAPPGARGPSGGRRAHRGARAPAPSGSRCVLVGRGDARESTPARRGGVRTPARRDALPARDGADAVRGTLRRGSAAGVGMERARHRRGRVLRFPESGGGPSAARANRVGRRAVADHARDQDADGNGSFRLQRGR